MILTLIVFLIILGLLVIVHEFGHFVVAKKTGVKVLEFAIGFPPRLFAKKRGETTYSINAVPLGGYVKMLGELEHSADKRAFENQKPGVRFWISISGVIMNLILAWVLLTIGFAVGMAPLVSSPESIPGEKVKQEVMIADVLAGSPAEKAGLKSKDIVLKINDGSQDTVIASSVELTSYDLAHRGQSVSLSIKRDDQVLVSNILLNNTETEQLGVALIDNTIVRVVWYQAPVVALRETVEVVKLTGQFLGSFFVNLFSHGKVAEGVGGPVAIYTYTGLAVSAGIMVLLQFVALLSINLALVNILPFPALDGGRIVFIILEKIYRKKVVRENIENIIHTVGFALLILLMLAVTYKDIIKLVK